MGGKLMDSETIHKVRQAVLARLEKLAANPSKLNESEKKALTRTIWRVGELGLEQSIPTLTRIAQDKALEPVEKYSIVWSLGFMKSHDSLELVKQLENSAEHVDIELRRICMEVRHDLTPEDEKQQLQEHYKSLLPDEILDALKTGNAQSLLDATLEYLRKKHQKMQDQDGPAWYYYNFRRNERKNISVSDRPVTDLILETLAILATDLPFVRNALLLFVQQARLVGIPNIAAFKSLWKIAEYRCDTELFAALVYRLENTKHEIPSYYWDEYGYGRGMKSSVPYLARRSWRFIRRMGEIGDKHYINFAKAILLSMHDKDGKEQRTETYSEYRWNQSTRNYDRHSWTTTFGEYSNYLTFGYILYLNSNRYSKSNTNHWVIKNESATDRRAEAFPELWDQHPDDLLNLLRKSQCAPVHRFAARALKDNKEYLKTISLDEWFSFIESKYEDTALLALEALKQHYADKEPDAKLIKTCLTSKHKQIRDAGIEWLKRASYILRDDIPLLVWMIMSDDQNVREMSQEYVYLFDGQEDKQQELFETLIGKTLELSEDVDSAIIANIRWVFLQPCKHLLHIITFDAIAMFIDHPSTGVKLLGAQILGAQNLKPHEIPPELYGRLFNSPVAEIRAEAISLMNNLQDAELAQWDDMLGNLILSDQQAVRHEARKLIARAIRADEQFGQKILQKLLAALFKSEDSDGLHDDLFDVFSHELKPVWHTIDKNQLWRMLTAKSKGVQRVSSVMLQQRPFSDYSVRQWATLGGNPSLSVRSWAWRAYEAELDRIRENIDDALHILSSTWEDSRSFAFRYFSENFPFDQWSENQVISLCDNKHLEVQKLGRNLVFEHIQTGQGNRYLLALSEHPSMTMQKFLGEFLQKLASDQTDKILEMEQYFQSVLMRVNKGRVAKDQVLEFLATEALKNRNVAEMVARIMQDLSLSAAIHDKAKSLEIMSDLNNKYPGLAMPVKVRRFEVRSTQSSAATQEAR